MCEMCESANLVLSESNMVLLHIYMEINIPVE